MRVQPEELTSADCKGLTCCSSEAKPRQQVRLGPASCCTAERWDRPSCVTRLRNAIEARDLAFSRSERSTLHSTL